LSSIDPILEYDLVRLINLCDPGMCRNGDYHSNDPEIYARDYKTDAAFSNVKRRMPSALNLPLRS
jgi:hypothetical protein